MSSKLSGLPSGTGSHIFAESFQVSPIHLHKDLKTAACVVYISTRTSVQAGKQQ
jgi:hypothetical protein